MTLTEEIRELLQQGREQAVAELAAANRRALRPLLGRLWDPDEEIRRHAARAIGHAGEAHPDLGLEVLRRLVWALNDESATNGVYGIPAIGEIGRRRPELVAPFVEPLVSMSHDAGLRLELIRALTAIAETAPTLVTPHLDRLESSLEDSHPAEREAFDRLATAAGKETRDGN
jgi:HEAT repeat protein